MAPPPLPWIITRCLSTLTRSSSSSSSSSHLHLNNPPPPDIDAILHKWKEMGVTQLALNRLPIPTIPAVWKKTALLLEQGFSPQQAAKMLDVSDTYSFLRVSYDKLASCLSFLKSLDVTGQNAGNILTKRIFYKQALLAYNVQMLEQKFDRFDQLGLHRALLTKMLLTFPSVVIISLEKFKSFLEYLRGLGMDSESLEKVFSKCPKILLYSLERTIIPTVSYLQNRGLSKEDTRRLFTAHPECFTRSADTRRRHFECLERLGLQKQIFNVYFQLSRCSSQHIEARIEWLISRGFSRVDVCYMVGYYPPMLRISNQCLSTKLEYLVKVMKRDIKQIVAYPMFLGFSLENRIKPRFNVLTKLEENGTLHHQFSLRYVLGLSEKKFVERFVKTLQA